MSDLAVEYDTLSGFTLTASEETVGRGGPITIRLENDTETEQHSGVKSKYTIHRKTPNGWRSIFYSAGDSPIAYHDPAIGHPPGGGFTWELTMSESGLAHEIEGGQGSVGVCSPLETGTYRFAYWGLGRTGGSESKEHALGVRFTVSDD